MVTLLYCARSELAECEAIAERLTTDDQRVVIRVTRHYEGEVERFFLNQPVTKVLITDSAAMVEEPYLEAGIPVEVLTDMPPILENLPKFEGEGEDDGESLPPGYRVTKTGSWWKAFSPGGDQIGKSKRTEKEAWEEAWAHHGEEAS